MKNMTFRKSLTAAAVAASLGFPALAIAQDAQTDVNAEEEVERIQVTGSRISRTDMETSSPVSVFDSEDILNSGVGTVSEFLRYTTVSGPGGNTESASLTQVAGSGSVDAKGFGSSYTLVLLNGRRLPVNAIASDFVDLNQIPLAAVERIEYLGDGASAIYGSDAVAGVVNVITKKDFQGADFNVSYGAGTEHGDGDEVNAQLVVGTQSADTSILFALDYWERRPIKASDREIGSTAYLPNVPNGDGRSPYGLPGWYEVYRDNNGDFLFDQPDEYYNLFADEACPERDIVGGSGGDEYCYYDFAPLYQIQPASDRQSIYTTINHKLTADLNAYGEFRYSRAYTKTSNAPAPGFINVAGSPYALDFLQNNLPQEALDTLLTTNGAGDTVIRDDVAFGMGRRWVDFPNRQKDNTNTTFSGIVGLNGYWGSYDWDFHVGHTKLVNRQIGAGGQLLLAGVEGAIADGGINPFEFNDFSDREGQELLNSLQASTHRTGESTQSFAGFTIGGVTGVELPGGNLGFAAGVDWRRESFTDRSDPATSDGQVIGGAGSNGEGARSVNAFYTEVAAPLFDGFELKGALRRDRIDWTGGDASKTTYQLGATYNINESYMVRASYGTGFKAPDLHQLFLGQSFGVTEAVDFTYCENVGIPADECPSRQLNSRSGGNTELEPEESKSWNVGLVAQPFENFDLTVDYWSLEVENIVGTLGIQEIINNEEQYPELVNRVNGRLFGVGDEAYILTNLQNLTEESAKGVSIDMNYLQEFGDFGVINWGLRADTQLEHLRQSSATQPLCDDIGTTSEPEWKANLSADWQNGAHSAGAHVRYLGTTDDYVGGRVSGSCGFQNDAIPVDSYTELDVYYGFQFAENQSIKVGLRNLTDENPPISTLGGWPFYDQGLYSNIGRFMYARYSVQF
ncbi:TonB-dependent receptor [Idiomarina sp. M1R2S28]|uniref:TonB-dependent receptor n=1 Tax=Idiomarina rhizosphaerae TaxID=2961572 RepID=A0A9X2JTJ5_9GAMM|nr:TonB-dependent receptor [Idiomarina rhizosphaerae]MCP1339975.1 TonB-dependent receptor [Idiomarina rhizosphaerae]